MAPRPTGETLAVRQMQSQTGGATLTSLKRCCSNSRLPPLPKFACWGIVSRTRLHAVTQLWPRHRSCQHSQVLDGRKRGIPGKAHEHGVQLVVVLLVSVVIRLHQHRTLACCVEGRQLLNSSYTRQVASINLAE